MRKPRGVPGPHAGGARESDSQPYPLGRGAGWREGEGTPANSNGLLNSPLAQLMARLEELENQLATQT